MTSDLTRSAIGYWYRPKSRVDMEAYLERFQDPRIRLVALEVHGDGFVRCGIVVDDPPDIAPVVHDETDQEG
jgi:hypothetical protein